MRGIKIRNLYGRFNYEIKFSNENLTILTGPNGYGKSTILHIINELANSNMDYFFDLQFSEIEILREKSNKKFNILKEDDILYINGAPLSKQDYLNWRKSHLHAIRNVEEQTADTPMSLLMLLIKETIYELKEITGNVYFVQEQRLLRKAMRRRIKADGSKIYEQNIIEVVDEIPDKIQNYMSTVAGVYSKTANELDSTFPQRLFEQEDGISELEFNEKLLSMIEKAGKLQKYAISEMGPINTIQFQERDSRALKVYFDDFERKYQPYEKLVSQLDLFTDIVNRRFSFKIIEISRTEGIRIKDDRGNVIPLTKLSSGEKETLVLFYQLIFEVQDGSILLIDEPEISLHVAWQRNFAEDIKEISREKKLNTIIATHSAQIVNGNREIQIDLGKQYAERLHKRKLD